MKSRRRPGVPLTNKSDIAYQFKSLFTQTLIIHIIRTNKIAFIQSRASWPLILTSLIIVAVGTWLTVSPLAETLGFVRLPGTYWLWLAGILLSYVTLTQVVKYWFNKRYSGQ